MDVTRERISRILELREILLSFQTCFSLVSAAVICAILENISGLEPSSVINEPRYLNLMTVSSFYPFTLVSVLMPLALFVISLVNYGNNKTPSMRRRLDSASSWLSPGKVIRNSHRRNFNGIL